MLANLILPIIALEGNRFAPVKTFIRLELSRMLLGENIRIDCRGLAYDQEQDAGFFALGKFFV